MQPSSDLFRSNNYIRCLELIAYGKKLQSEHDDADTDRSFATFKRAAALRMKQILSGYQLVTYTATGSDKSPDETDFGDVLKKNSLETHMGWFSWLTMQGFMDFFYDPLDEPIRQYTVDDVLEFTPFITNNSWGLESVYCRDRQSRFIAIINGESALTKQQVQSSLACFLFGFVMTLFVMVGFLMFMGAGGSVIFVAVGIYLYSVYDSAKSQIGLNSAYQHVLSREDGSTRSINRKVQSDALYQVQETYRISEPRQEMYWVFLVGGLLFFLIIPFYALFKAGNYRVLLIFLFLSTSTALRSIFNAPSVSYFDFNH